MGREGRWGRNRGMSNDSVPTFARQRHMAAAPTAWRYRHHSSTRRHHARAIMASLENSKVALLPAA